MSGGECRVVTQLLRVVRTPRTAKGEYVSDRNSWRIVTLPQSNFEKFGCGGLTRFAKSSRRRVAPEALLSEDRIAEWNGYLPYDYDPIVLCYDQPILSAVRNERSLMRDMSPAIGGGEHESGVCSEPLRSHPGA